LRSSGHTFSELLLVLVTGLCIAASSLFATESKTPTTAPKPVAHPVTSHPATHYRAGKAGTTAAASHAGTKPKGAAYSASTHAAPGKPAWHPAYSSTTRVATNRTQAHAPQHGGTTAHNRYAHPSAPWTPPIQHGWGHLRLAPERVQEIQQALIRDGYLQGDASGEWDTHTRDAMLRYQTMHGFPPTGLPEAKSLMKLGLGPHPLPPELDHGEVGVAAPGAISSVQNVFTVSPTTPPDAPPSPPNLNTAPPESK